ncbi:MAG: TIR domain-containing protein [Clostridia bacterium]|nr:TIR domain-containing protein [Clostridia bacterium]
MAVYEGKEPYIFVSYAHKDTPTVLPIIEGLQARGFRVWYDGGIEAGTEWPEYIAEHLESCAVALLFISDYALASRNCIREINFAISEGRDMLAIYLSDVKMSSGMKMQLGTLQAMFYNRFLDRESFIAALCGARLIQKCRDGANSEADETPAAVEDEEDLSAFFGEKKQKKAAKRLAVDDLSDAFPIRIYRGSVTDDVRAQISENARIMNRLFNDSDVKALVSEVEIGPRITTYYVTFERGIRVKQLENFVEDLKFSLALDQIRYVISSQRAQVGFELLNSNQELISLEELLKEARIREEMNIEARTDTSVPLGRDTVGSPVFGDIAKFPHLLISGITQTGKTTFLHSMIVTMITRVPKERLRLVLVDLKGVEFDIYNEEPHMLLPVIHDSVTAAKMLSELCEEMERRYKLFMDARVRSLEQYNETVAESDRLARIIFIVDDYTDLVFNHKKEIETAVMRLSQKSRAAGIHLILSTPRTEAATITGVLKANMPSRIAFRTFYPADSRMIIDTAEATELDDRGDALLSQMAQTNCTRISTPYIAVEKIISIVNYLVKTEGKAEYNTRLLRGLTAYQPLEVNLESVRGYKSPSPRLLNNKPTEKPSEAEREIKETGEAVINTLRDSFNVKATLGEVVRGPRFTKFEVIPTRRIGAARLKDMTVFISMSLSVSGAFAYNGIGDSVYFFIPNKRPYPVYLRGLLESPEFAESNLACPICIGRDLDGSAVIWDLKDLPHALVAGATSTGKSVFLNTLVLSILFKAKPSEVKLILIDTKQVEFGGYAGIPHLLTPVIRDTKKAGSALAWVIEEMERRYELFYKLGVSNIDEYGKMQKSDPSIGENMPRIVVVADEIQDLMLHSKESFESLLMSILKKSRAAGIHLILATQRPSVDVISGTLKANIPTRIAFKTATNADSRIILDQSGAESLLGGGDMLFFNPKALSPIRLQGAFVSYGEVETVVNSIKDSVKSRESFIDELLFDAVELAFALGGASTSLIQRKFSIGYGRAARLIDAMYNLHIISEANGGKPRDLLITYDEWEDIKERLENEEQN